MNNTDIDPKRLIHEAYRIDGITASECRSIFLDWALSLPGDQDTSAALNRLAQDYAANAPDHPMSEVLLQSLTQIATPKRRGGWRSRPRS